MHLTSKHYNNADTVSGNYGKRPVKKIGAYLFGNVFFYLYWQNSTTTMKEFYRESSNQQQNDTFKKNIDTDVNNRTVKGDPMPYLITQMKIRRTKKPHLYGRRSKYIVRPEGVVMLGNHNVHKYVNGKKCDMHCKSVACNIYHIFYSIVFHITEIFKNYITQKLT